MVVKQELTKDIYPMLLDWWKGNNFPPVSPSMLPQYTFVCYKEGTPIYSMCFYNTDSHLAWVGWQLANSNTEKSFRKGGLEFLFKEVESYAKGMGYQIVFTTSNVKPVEDVLMERDFKIGDVNVNHYVKILS